MAGGRPAGTLGSKTLKAIGIVEAKGCDPLGILCDIAMGVKMKCGMTIEGITFEVEQIASLDQRKDAAKELCTYIYPKRKAVEHSGIDGEDIAIVKRIERVIVDPANKDS